MATQKKIIEMIGVVKTVFSFYAKETDVPTLIKTWALLLKDYPDEAVETAFYKCLQTCKMPPAPADIIEQLHSMVDALEPSDEELWSVLIRAVNKVTPELSYLQYPLYGETPDDAHRRIEAIFNGLPEKVKQYVGSKGELMNIARNYSDNDLKFEKTRFLKTMPTIKKRVEYNQIALKLGGDLKQIEG